MAENIGTPEMRAVVGLGVLGQLCAQLHRLAGQYVIGWDKIPFRVETARDCGIHTVVVEDLDGATIAFGGNADSAVKSLAACMKKYPDGHPAGVVTIVGGATFEYSSDIRRSARTGFGYHDPEWEVGREYPPVAMRWTTRTNLELCMRLIAEERLDVDRLTTHVMAFDTIESELTSVLNDPDALLGVVFEYK